LATNLGSVESSLRETNLCGGGGEEEEEEEEEEEREE
jgi:hypothetical protein